MSIAMDDVQPLLYAYTLQLGDPGFLHQHVVDAFGAQLADNRTTPIQLTFSLVGLYLYVERRSSGRDVQQVHAELARRRPTWPAVEVPANRGSMTAADVLAKPEGSERDAAIAAWCASVWSAYAASRGAVIEFLTRNGII